VGVGLARLIVFFSVLIGPIYLVWEKISQPDVVFEWLHRHTVSALAVSLLLLALVRGAALLAKRTPKAPQAWLPASCEFILMILIVLQICEIQRNLYADAFPYVDDVNEPFRKPVEQQLAALPGKHLVLVRYSKGHNSGEEYVYNGADIDLAKTVWAREIPGVDIGPLLRYFSNRDVWLFEPDTDDESVSKFEFSVE